MKKYMLFILSILFVLTFSCKVDDSATLSGDAYILTFEIDGMVGEAEIDETAGTVVITVEPLDITAVDPVITVSEGATLGAVPELKDGEAVPVSITAENGDIREWQITVNVESGVSFVLDGSKIILQEGRVDSSSSANTDALGGGEPAACYLGELYFFAADKQYDTISAEPADYKWFKPSMKNYPANLSLTENDVHFDYLEVEDSSLVLRVESPYSGPEADISLVISNNGSAGEYIIGTFTLTTNDSSHAITNGYFKLLRCEDDAWGFLF